MKKRLNVSKAVMKTKWLVVLIAAILLIVLGRIVQNNAVLTNSIIIGLGIDYSENRFIVTTQSVVPTASSAAEGASTTNYDLYTEQGATITEAIDKIGLRMGLKPSLAHCNLLVLSQSALKIRHLQLIDPLTGILAMPEQAVIVTGAMPPKDLLSKRVATTVNAPFYLQTALFEHMGSEGTERVTIKDFLAKTSSKSAALFIPYIEAQKLEDPPMTSEDEIKDAEKLIFEKALAFNQTDSALLDKRLTQAAALYDSFDVNGVLEVGMPSGATVEFRVTGGSQKTKAQDKKVEAEIELNVTFLELQFGAASMLPPSDNATIIKQAAALLEEQLAKDLIDCFLFSQTVNIDFLGLQELVYQKMGPKLEKDALQSIEFSPKFKLKLKENFS